MLALMILLATAVPLRDEVAAADAAMFAAFNAHDADKLGTWFSEDLEFYHDKDGKLSYADSMKGFRSLLGRNDGLHRELVKDSLQVYPVPGYGAMEIGTHRFCHTENGKDDCGTFGFAMVWQKDGGRWRVTRVLSFDHK